MCLLCSSIEEKGDSILWNKPQGRLRLSAVAGCCPKYINESSKVSWHTDSNVKNGCDWLCVADLGNSEALTQTAKERRKKPWRKSFATLHIFTSAGGDRADDAAVMSPAASRRKLRVPCLRICDARRSGSASMWRRLIWVRGPCKLQTVMKHCL